MRAFITALVVAAAAAPAFAQSPPKGIERSIDKFTGAITDRSRIELLDQESGAAGSIFLGLMRIQSPKDTTAGLAIVTAYMGREWLWVQPGESMLVKADDSVFAVSRSGEPKTDITTSGTAQEFTAFPITKDELALISKAKSVSFRFRGRNRNEERDLSKPARTAVEIFARWIATDSSYRYLRR